MDHRISMVHVDTACSLESFRRFLIDSTCLSFIPESYLSDPEVFPEKEGEAGSIYVEAADKVTLKRMREITFINARDVLGIIYVSKSGNSKLKWRQVRGRTGKVSGEASTNSLVNLVTARVITSDYVMELAKGASSRATAGQAQYEEGVQQPTEEEAEAFAFEEEASSKPETPSTEVAPRIEGDV